MLLPSAMSDSRSAVSVLQAAAAAPGAAEYPPLQRTPSTSLPSQDVLDHSRKKGGGSGSGAAQQRNTYISSGSSGASAGFGGPRRMPMRPSMELRCKQLDLSLLQVMCPPHTLCHLHLAAA